MKLILQLVNSNIEELEPFIDGWYVNEQDLSEDLFAVLPRTLKPIWLQLNEVNVDTKELITNYPFVNIIAPYEVNFKSEQDYAMYIGKLNCMGANISNFIIPWDGRKRYLNLLKSSGQLALSAKLPRGWLIDNHYLNAKNLHYIEFSSTDELRRSCPASMTTVAPIAAALRGIYLASRERRPKQLPHWINPWQKEFSTLTLELAIKNILAITEAASWTTKAMTP